MVWYKNYEKVWLPSSGNVKLDYGGGGVGGGMPLSRYL